MENDIMELSGWEAIHDRVLIKPDPTPTEVGGFEMLEKERDQKHTGEVIMVGTGVPLHNIHLNITGDVSAEALTILERCIDKIENGRKMRVEVGQKVIYGKYAGTKVKFDNQEYIMIREADVFLKK